VPDPKNYAVTDLSASDLKLTLAGVDHAVVGFSATFAVNEIPTAQCYVAVGRDVTDGASKAAAAHTQLKSLLTSPQMTEARVTFSPRGEYSPDGTPWPAADEAPAIFDGYVAGATVRKVSGKFVVVINLIHWLIDLACSSTLTAHGHASNPTQLNAAAVLDSLDTTNAGQGIYVSSLAASQLVGDTVADDVWAAIKTVFCKLAGTETQPSGPAEQCAGTGTYSVNDRALLALMRIEGPGSSCAVPYRDGVPLKLDLDGVGAPGSLAAVQDAVADSIGMETLETYGSTTFWDKMIRGYFPLFGLAIVPMVDTAIVIADTPAYRGGVWRTIEDEEDSLDFAAATEMPLRGVGVIAAWESETQAGVGEDGEDLPLVGGCFVADSVEPGDGVIQFVEAPDWLRMAFTSGAYAGETTGIPEDEPARAAGADAAGAEPAAATPEAFGDDLNGLYRRYAQTVYANSTLRGRSGTMPGKLRFDVAPGSIVRIRARPEKFLAGDGEDALAATLIGCTSRVTVALDAEGPAATTAFQFTHVRFEDPENTRDRTSVDGHPLFGKAIHGGGKHGSPLSRALTPPDPAPATEED
jgi:hypothetical protein